MKTFVLLWLQLLMLSLFTASDTNPTSETYTLINSTNLAKPGCPSRCGNVIVPYPFGIIINNNTNCSISHEFDIYCNTSVSPPKASFTKTDKVSIKRISDSTLRTSNNVASKCYYPDGTFARGFNIWENFTDWPYTFSEVNKFTVIGCADYAWLTSETDSRYVSTGCATRCPTLTDVEGDQCSGNGCCQSSIPKDINYYRSRVYTMDDSVNISYTRSFNPCAYAFAGEEKAFQFKGVIDLNDTSLKEKIEANVPIVFDWAIGNLSCTEAESTDGFACQYSNSKCVDSTRESGGYRCICNEGYEGNPYLSPGCQDINECRYPETIPCYGTCVNTVGSYTCNCKKGYSGNAKIPDGCRRKPVNPLMIYIGTGSVLLAILIVQLVSYFTAQKRKCIMLREQFFEQNGGMLLEEKLKTKSGVGVGSMKVFRARELEEATDKYAEDKILGRGGNGIVYKGNLLDNRVVAIKKSQRLDQGQREQFINEMVILTQINHQNVVQLLGCCLETEVPLLVYEFISNDTLHHHIHDRKSGMGRLSWENRLRIAHESAGALAYLHTDARMSIIHRDVKSSNILLDDNYTTKIADFGASRLVPLGHDQVTTLVQGTFGYLDPEYFHTGQLTDKSDVYSFGVVIVELLTGKKPLAVERCLKERNLATYFVKAVKENKFLEILECQVVNEATDEQLKETCGLACRCLNQLGENRPSMKEVTMELEMLRKLCKHPWGSSQDKYNEMSSLMIESEPNDLYDVPLIVNGDTFGEYGSSTSVMKDMMHQVQSPR